MSVTPLPPAQTSADQTQNDGLIYYFAYGSNLSLAQMSSRCPGSTFYGVGLLYGWVWLINERGYANIAEIPAQYLKADTKDMEYHEMVWGFVFTLTPDDVSRLDECEEVPWAYTKEILNVNVWKDEAEVGKEEEGGNQEKMDVLVYLDRKRFRKSEPRAEYVGRMQVAAKDLIERGRLPASEVLRRKVWVLAHVGSLIDLYDLEDNI